MLACHSRHQDYDPSPGQNPSTPCIDEPASRVFVSKLIWRSEQRLNDTCQNAIQSWKKSRRTSHASSLASPPSPVTATGRMICTTPSCTWSNITHPSILYLPNRSCTNFSMPIRPRRPTPSQPAPASPSGSYAPPPLTHPPGHRKRSRTMTGFPTGPRRSKTALLRHPAFPRRPTPPNRPLHGQRRVLRRRGRGARFHRVRLVQWDTACITATKRAVLVLSWWPRSGLHIEIKKGIGSD